MADFQDRQKEMATVEACDPQTPLLTLYGVAGIGKSRLLAEAETRLSEKGALVIRVDLERMLTASPGNLLQAIIAAAPQRLRGIWSTPEKVADEIVTRLGEFCGGQGVYLMVDTTECVQGEHDFWRWIEAHLVGPLILRTHVRLVFAGRVPAPWRRYEVRRAVRLMSLDPLPANTAARKLIEECLALYSPDAAKEAESAFMSSVVSMLLGFCQGHPLLAERLSEEAAPHLGDRTASLDALKADLRVQVIQPFVEGDLFGELEPPWPEILTWASLLDEFDLYTLDKYLAKLDFLKQAVAREPPYFLNQGIGHMKNRFALVFHQGEGYSVHGILRDIVREQAAAMHPVEYRKALEAAKVTYAEIADDLAGEPEADVYRCKARAYDDRIESQRQEDAPQ